MIVIWRGHGWAIPLIAFFTILLMDISVDAALGDGYFSDHTWPMVLGIVIASLLIGALGYYLNYKKRLIGVNPETGQTVKSKSHSLFFIPVEFWALIIPVLSYLFFFTSLETDLKEARYIASPQRNDLYLADFSKIFDSDDSEFIYGIMKATAVSGQDVEVVISEFAWDGRSGPLEAARMDGSEEPIEFSPDPVAFNIEELTDLKENGTIYAVIRPGDPWR